ncbi:MAG: DUF4147 domain-containing protein [Methylococcales bacterium]
MPQTIIQARNQIQEIFQAGIIAADPAQAIRQAMSIKAGRLFIDVDSEHKTENRLQRSEPWSAVHVIAFGKAACAMTSAANEIISTTLTMDTGIIVTNYENVIQIDGFNVIGAGHPLPDNQGMIAARQIAEHAQQAQAGELVLVLISGGGSALIPYPPKGISLQDKIDTTSMLLNSGASINEMNCVRKHLSELKGGNLTKLAYPADIHALILSDVIGDDLSSIASGPTVPDDTTFDDAVRILQSRNLWQQLPDTICSHLLAGRNGNIDETPKPGNPIFDRSSYCLIGSNGRSVSAMQRIAQQAGFDTVLYDTTLCGEAREEAVKLCTYAAQKLTTISTPTALVAGGETTVKIVGKGLGGRNQEFALAFALAANQIGLAPRWIFLSGGTDGRDGPTDAAGAIVDSDTLSKIIAAGGNAANYLDNNDSYHALKLANNLLITGATGTNVADLQVLLLFPDDDRIH